jgi:peptidoglycan/LPS O-acetylase OafA/YrhL
VLDTSSPSPRDGADPAGHANGGAAAVKKSQYRPDIDGLRAIAVLSIFLFHIDDDWMPGGYVGVDIFFVISGYLIGGIVLKDVMAGRFSLLEFYSRRFKRIIPALFAMLAGVTALAWFTLFPTPFRQFASSMLATTFSVSNIYFQRTTGYFDIGAHSKPLLHTWSLGVEEQFYIFFPLALLGIYRLLRGRVWLATMLAFAVSLTLSEMFLYRAPDKTFYWLPFRAWELLLGFLIVITPLKPLENKLVRNILSLAGLAAIIATFALYKPWTPFPGLSALLPCAGSAAIIAAGRIGPNLVGRLLSLRPFVLIGLISYSLYLWHWPIIVLAHEAVPIVHFSVVQGLGIFVAGILLGWLSWRYVERPFRSERVTRRRIFTFSAAGAALISLMALAIAQGQGIPGRFPPDVVKMAGYIDFTGHIDLKYSTCFPDGSYDFSKAAFDPCLKLDPSRPNVALIGDSHAGHLFWGLEQTMPDVHVIPALGFGCPARLNSSERDLARCSSLMQFVFRQYLPSTPVDLVILAGRWTERDPDEIRAMLGWLKDHGKKVVFVGPVQRYTVSLPKLLALAKLKNEPHLADQFLYGGIRPLDEQLRKEVTALGVPYISSYDILCAKGCVQQAANGAPLQFDEAHYTDEGSIFVAAAMRPMLFEQLGMKPR